MSQHCYHCHLEIPQGIDIHATLDGQEQQFCCYACLGVAEMIASHDLSAYYQVRDNIAPRPDQHYNAEHWQAYDIPEIAAQYVFSQDSDQEIHLYIEGIHCAACSWLIRGALNKEALVEDVQVNTTTGRAQIRWRDSKLSDILATIAKLGYTPNLFTPQADEQQQHQARNQSLLRLIVAGLGMMQVMMFATGLYTGAFFGIDREYSELLRWISLLVTTPVMFYSGWPFLTSAWQGLRIKKANMDLPIAVATLGAYTASVYHTVIGKGEIYFDSVTMFIFFISISRFLEFMARRRARLNDIRYAKLLPDAVEKCIDGEVQLVPLTTVQPNDEIIVRATHTIPVDGEVIAGSSRVDEAMLSGESTPLSKGIGDRVLAGSNNLASPITLRVVETGQRTTLAGIRRLVARAEQHRSPLIDRNEQIAQHTIIAVIVLALAGYIAWQFIDAGRAFEVALAVLVATCPCALSLATPTALTSAMNHANAHGILIKDSNTLHKLRCIKHIIFDKTGTLTDGHLSLIDSQITHSDPALVWQIAKALEANSNHPIAWFFARQDVSEASLQSVEYLSGQGVWGKVDGKDWYIGSAALMNTHGWSVSPPNDHANHVYLANTSGIQAEFSFADPLRPQLARTLSQLNGYQLHIASGDREENVATIAGKLGIDDYHGGLSPEAKLAYLESIDAPSLMIGDGINDAPVLAAADVSVAVGKASPLSQTHADIVLLGHGPQALPFLFDLAQRCERIIRQNLWWAAAYNLTILPLAIFGFLTPWIAAIGMSASSLLVVLNALRVNRTPPPETLE
ncbi:cadmium-translocating P-type ATPase [Suttonella sp. R2A3]|uniref:heavy metal translocating P-type ATPase n=1 Tax=Suttonella sp. R2A3 TaxID=2908648 RepID=UPI001F40DA4E|nr:heavy metal translocating P-type ATPase [Suttonella sp. R2A3]UJF23986.1 cadmium-translocating P-type ATPase [Suttonella sp. R2A3]